MYQSNDNADVVFLKAFFRELQLNHITYCILRNTEEVQEGDAHDIDMTIDISRSHETESALSRTAAQYGWQLHLKTGNLHNNRDNKCCYHYFLIEEEEQRIHVVHIDIFPSLNWQGIELLPNQVMISGVRANGLFPMAAESVEATINLFTNLLFNGYVKDKYKNKIQKVFLSQPDKTKCLMRYFLSENACQHVYQLTCSAQWDTINKERTSLVDNINKTARHTKWNLLRYRLDKALYRKGLIVAFLGTDGSGKSTAIRGVEKLLGNSFSGDMLQYYHWRPGFIHAEKKYTPDGQLVSNVQPHTQKPYGKIKSFAKIVFYTLDYILGHIGEVYWKAAKGNMVVFDRYYYDFYMDKIRYRLSVGDKVVRFFQFLIPQPDITFLLIGDAQQIYQRKPELSIDEIQRQIDSLLAHREQLANPFVVDVNQSIDCVQFCICKKILNALAARNAR